MVLFSDFFYAFLLNKKIPSFGGDFLLGVESFKFSFFIGDGRLDFQGLVLVCFKDLEKEKLTDIGFILLSFNDIG